MKIKFNYLLKITFLSNLITLLKNYMYFSIPNNKREWLLNIPLCMMNLRIGFKYPNIPFKCRNQLPKPKMSLDLLGMSLYFPTPIT